LLASSDKSDGKETFSHFFYYLFTRVSGRKVSLLCLLLLLLLAMNRAGPLKIVIIHSITSL